MSAPLYNIDILRLAADIPHHRRLEHPQGSAELRSPVCGSRIAVDVTLDADGRVSELGLDAHACALGQASASLMAAHALGKSAGELAAARDGLAAFLSGDAEDMDFWPGISVLAAARGYAARHASIRLAFEAAALAAERAVEFTTGRVGN